MRTFSKKALALVLSLVFVVGCIIPVAAAGKTFGDVKESQWFYSYVDYMSEKQVIVGDAGTGLFRPNDNVKRNEFIKMVNCVFGLTDEADVSFSDVPATSWYAPYYRAAYKQGYLQEAFGSIAYQEPTKELTREEAVALLMAYMDPEIDISNQTLSFTDASSINPKYKDFILESVYQGIVVGYDDDTFKPRKTLTRAEAAKILCVAAGTILSGGTATTPETTVSGNVVINGNSTTLGFNADDVIVTEAVDGIVAIKNVTINGTVYIRGGNTSSVEFSNCKVAEIVVEGDSLVVLSGGTTVTDVILENSCMVGFNGASVKNFTVAAGAKDSIVRSEGSANAIENYAIYASGFNSQIVHSGSIAFGTGLKATIGGKEYSGSGFAANSLRTSWKDGEEYITYSVVNDGYVDYFYSLATIDTTKFATLYNATAASLKGTKAVTVGQYVNEKTANAAMTYKYIVVAFRTKSGEYEGVKVIDRELELYGLKNDLKATYASGGFKVSFTVAISDAAHTGWKTYYTFTDDKSFGIDDINKTISTYKTLASGKTFTEAEAEGKKYIAVFVYENGIIHAPRVVEIPVFYNGFTSTPTITINGGDKADTLSYALPGSGKIKYMYVDSLKESYTKNETVFNNEYRAMASDFKGEITVYGSGTKTSDLKKASAVANKPYVILCVEGNNPVAVTRMYAGTGFAANPVAYEIGNNRAIAFTSTINGTLKYAYVDSLKSLTVRDFNELYANTTATLRGEITGCQKDKARFAALKTEARATKYVAVMLNDGNADYQPICIQLTDPGTGIKSASFSADIIANTLKLTASHAFGDNVVVSYEAFYVDSKSVTLKNYLDLMKKAAGDNIQANMMFDASEDLSYAFGINADGTVTGGRLPTEDEKQIVIRLVINSDYVLAPMILDIAKVDYGFNANTLATTESNGREVISLTLKQAGTIKYYYTNTAPTTTAAFDSGFTSAIYSGKKTVSAAGDITMGDAHIYALAEYKYIVFLFEDKDGVKRVPQVYFRSKTHTTGVVSAKAEWNDVRGINVSFTVMDIFGDANVTPLVSYMTATEKKTNLSVDDFRSFNSLNGMTDTDGLIGITYTLTKDVKYIYIVIGVTTNNDKTPEYKFVPLEIEVTASQE